MCVCQSCIEVTSGTCSFSSYSSITHYVDSYLIFIFVSWDKLPLKREGVEFTCVNLCVIFCRCILDAYRNLEINSCINKCNFIGTIHFTIYKSANVNLNEIRLTLADSAPHSLHFTHLSSLCSIVLNCIEFYSLGLSKCKYCQLLPKVKRYCRTFGTGG